MDDTRFDSLAERTLTALVTALDAIDGVEAELSQGVLTIGFDAGGPAFVVNSHRAARQIWIALRREPRPRHAVFLCEPRHQRGG